MRRRLPAPVALAALALVAVFIARGAVCGVRSVSEPCFSQEECEAKSECVAYVHPFLWGYAVVAAAAVALALAGLRMPLLALGVLGAGVGALAGLSLGLAGILVGLVVLLAGATLPPRAGRERADRLTAGAALLAAVLPVPLMILVLGARPPAEGVVWLAAFGPGLAWLALAVWMELRRGERGRADA